MLMVILRFVHIVLGILWVGSVFAITVILVPGMQQLGLPLDPVMRTLQHRKFSQIMMSFGGLTVLAGLSMMFVLSRGHEAEYFSSPMGRTLSLGGLCAILALVLGGAVSRPALEKAAKLRAEIGSNAADPRMAEVAALQKRLVVTSKAVIALLLIAISCMAIARYV